MKTRGIIRHFDKEGRIVIPKEHRKMLNLKDEETMEIFVEDNTIVLKKYCGDKEDNVVKLPCQVGDKVKFRALCECVKLSYNDSGEFLACPFKDSCEFDDCNNGNEKEFVTTVKSIYNNGSGWYVTLEDIDIEISIVDFGRSITIVEEEGVENG